ncbi:MAG: hypothetical protein KIH67_000465 [Candidatus Moranbacteria bacterium]|nr:hypothetical protein [Candidatus Moranbacteria bacterium]
MRKINGVGLFLLNKEREFYAIEELVMKRGVVSKNAGDLSIPLETMNAGERHEDAIRRLYVEEVDAHGVIVTTAPLYIGKYVFAERHQITSVFLYQATLLELPRVPFVGSHGGEEYNPYGFISEGELLEKGRHGTEDLLRVWHFWLGHLE